jgi:hypothetical protein
MRPILALMVVLSTGCAEHESMTVVPRADAVAAAAEMYGGDIERWRHHGFTSDVEIRSAGGGVCVALVGPDGRGGTDDDESPWPGTWTVVAAARRYRLVAHTLSDVSGTIDVERCSAADRCQRIVGSWRRERCMCGTCGVGALALSDDRGVVIERLEFTACAGDVPPERERVCAAEVCFERGSRVAERGCPYGIFISSP